MPTDTYYDLLELPSEAPADDVRRAYLAQVSQCHPDRLVHGSEEWNRANERLKDLNAAYATLKDARRRATYDRDLLTKGQAVVQKSREQGPTQEQLDAKIRANRERYRAALSSDEVRSFCGAIGMEKTRLSALAGLDRFEAAPARDILRRFLAHSS